MTRKIFIFEDDQNRVERFRKLLPRDILTITDSVDSAKKILSENTFDIALLDHDMDHQIFVESTSPNTGYQVALFIAHEKVPFHQVIVHSHNPAGAENMMRVLNTTEHIKEIYQVPFGSLVGILKVARDYGPT